MEAVTRPTTIVGLGHDLQRVAELEGREGLFTPDAFFSEQELCHARAQLNPLQTLASIFSVREAFFKAIPIQQGWSWSELAFSKEASGRPALTFSGALERLMREHGWSALVTLSHSGEYVSSCVLIQEWITYDAR